MDLNDQRDGPRVREPRSGAAADRRPLALVLHDDPRMVAHVHAVVTAEGLEARSVATPLRVLESTGREVALVVLGVTAIEERDLELVPLVREHFPAARVLVLYPTSLRERAAAALGLGADATLPEPFYPGELAAHARHALLGRGRPALNVPSSTASARSAIDVSDAASVSTPASMERVARPEAHAPSGPLPDADPGAPTPAEQLALGVAHGIRNPLQILELVLGNAEAGDELDMEELRVQLERIRSVADDLSRVGMRTRVDQTIVDVNSLVREVFPVAGRKSDARCVVALCEGDVVVRGEPGMLREAFELLQRRAQRVTPRGATVRVTTRRRDDVIEIEVTDGGPELRPDQRLRFFQPQPDPDVVREGTWLEMAVLAGIVRNHGGSTELAPDDGSGTTVIVRLPSARTPVAAR